MTAGQSEALGLDGERSLSGLLSVRERDLLELLARHLPIRMLPDHLTTIGVLGAVLAAAGLAASHASPYFLWLGVLGLVLNWAGDSLDGTLARIRHIERPRYGFFVDHTTDIASQLLIVFGLGLSPLMRVDAALLALVGYLCLSTYTYVKLHVARTMQLSYFGMGPTEVRLLIGAGLVIEAFVDLPQFRTPAGVFGLFDIVGIALFVFAMVSGAAMFARDAGQLALIDPVRRVIPTEVRMTEIEPAGTADHISVRGQRAAGE